MHTKRTHTLCPQATSWGCEDVHEAGSTVSSALVNPLHDRKPRHRRDHRSKRDRRKALAARLVVERWPTNITGITSSRYSDTCILDRKSITQAPRRKRTDHAPKNRPRVAQEHPHLAHRGVPPAFARRFEVLRPHRGGTGRSGAG